MEKSKKPEEKWPYPLRLREAAEEELRRSLERLPAGKGKKPEDPIRELQVHQIELKMQNEELRRTQEELQASQKKYFDLYDLAPVGYLILSEKGVILEANRTAATLLGVDKGTLGGQPFTRLILPEDQDLYYRHHKQLLEFHSERSGPTGTKPACELRMKKKDGRSFWTRVEVTVAENTEGSPLYRVVMSDITERKRAEEALLESEKSLEELNERILTMVMVLTHDVRGPLISIVSILNLLLRGIYGKLDQNITHTVQELLSRCLRLFGTIEDYLGKASFASGSMGMKREKLDIRQDIIDTVLDELADDITHQEIRIDNRLGTIPAGSVAISADQTWLKSVYRNLFSHAIKNGGKGSTISFGYEPCETHYRLNVYNSGKPIPEPDREKLFSRFGRIENEGRPPDDGLDPGLALSREIILEHGGEIWYEAQPDGSNVVFTIFKEEGTKK